MVFLLFLIVPLLISLVAWILTNRITWKELLVQVVAQIILIGVMVCLMVYSEMSDLEVWNGVVTSKHREKVSCSHSYSCHCVDRCSGSGKSRTCHRVCQTCYDHSYDVDWYAKNNIGERFEIDRVDRQGAKEPPRFASIQTGEPTSSTHRYQNYIKGNPSSLFRKQGLVEKYKDRLPEYPIKVYDYYKLNRLVTVGVSLPDINSWNVGLSEINGALGQSKQVNVLVVVAKDFGMDYYSAIEQHWLGGKKNDVITVIGVDSSMAITWVEVMSLSNEEFKIKLRDSILEAKVLDREKILPIIKNSVQNYYVRKPMKDFEYLKAAIQPSPTQWVVGLI